MRQRLTSFVPRRTVIVTLPLRTRRTAAPSRVLRLPPQAGLDSLAERISRQLVAATARRGWKRPWLRTSATRRLSPPAVRRTV
jgi:hypothetical protein